MSYRILLVDDDRNLLEVAKSYLTQEEPIFELTTVTSAHEALISLEKGYYDIIISDYRMPDMDGLSLLEQLRKEGNNIPFIIFTGQGCEEVAIRALNLGADYYLKKEGSSKTLYRELAHIIRSLMRYKETEEALQKSHDELEELVRERTALLVQANEQLKQENAERLQIEEALRESEQKYRELVEKLQEGVLTEDTEGVITFCNPRAAELLGYSMRELIGQHLSITVPNGELEKIRKERAKKIDAISNIYEMTLLSKDGQLIPVVISSTPLLGQDKAYRGTLSIFMDISEVKRAELALQESQEQYRELVEKMQEGVLVEDAEGIMTFVNPKTAEMVGYSVHELIGRPAISIVPEAYKAKIHEETTRRKDGFSSTYEAALLTKDKRIIPVIIHATPLFSENQEFRGVLAVFTDITDRKRVEQTLERERMAFQIIAEAAIRANTIQDLCQRILIGIVEVFNFDSGVICLYEENEKLLRPMAMVGLTESEAGEKILPENLDSVDNVAAHVARTRQAIFAPDIYQHGIYKDCKSRLEEFNVRSLVSWPIKGTRQNLLGVIVLVGFSPKEIIEKDQVFFATMAGLFSTVLERKKAEEQLKRQKEELSEFVHAMSHDIRNKLLSIEGYASLLEGEYKKSYAERTRRLAQDMNDLLRRSVELADAGLVIGDRELLDLTLLVNNVARAVIPENISFVQDDLLIVPGDREKLLQVFQNLFENAITHGMPTKIEVRKQNDENGTSILIINNGKLISSEDREKIFQRGFTTKEEGKGLGLTIVQKLVEAHGWKIDLEPSSETRFRIFIPSIK
ncbi:MAG: PAS domain S-box protein [Candidatus Hodarchaeota archaeon]